MNKNDEGTERSPDALRLAWRKILEATHQLEIVEPRSAGLRHAHLILLATAQLIQGIVPEYGPSIAHLAAGEKWASAILNAKTQPRAIIDFLAQIEVRWEGKAVRSRDDAIDELVQIATSVLEAEDDAATAAYKFASYLCLGRSPPPDLDLVKRIEKRIRAFNLRNQSRKPDPEHLVRAVLRGRGLSDQQVRSVMSAREKRGKRAAETRVKRRRTT